MCHHDRRGVEELAEAMADIEPSAATDDADEGRRTEPDEEERLPPIQPSD